MLPGNLQEVISALRVLVSMILRKLKQRYLIRRWSLVPYNSYLAAVVQFRFLLLWNALMRRCEALEKLCYQMLLTFEYQ